MFTVTFLQVKPFTNLWPSKFCFLTSRFSYLDINRRVIAELTKKTAESSQSSLTKGNSGNSLIVTYFISKIKFTLHSQIIRSHLLFWSSIFDLLLYS